MCGIAGIAGRRDEALVKGMTDALAHRGPDDEGVYADDHVTLGHRRLSIIDLSAGHQPMSNAEGTLWIVYNGEVYNFQELRQQLESRGQVFRTQSDTEVILAAYEVFGDACVERLQGMFAFALWDTRERRLLLARDPVGVKPLYYAQAGGMLYFASEMKALLQCPHVERAIDFEALDDYLTYLYTVPPRTFFRSIRQLPPGHLATWQEGTWSMRRYWRLRFEPEERPEGEWAEAVYAKLGDTVGKHMIADVPLGAFLSGGLDSASIVHHMAQRSAKPLTFTIGFGAEGNQYDESAEAREMAAFFGTQHHELTVEADVVELLPVLVRHFDEPFGNPTALLTYALCKLVREHVTVILSGDGGDECFGGYPRYAGAQWAQHYRKIPAALRRYALNPLIQLLPESTRGFHTLRRVREFSAGTLLDPVDMYASWIGYYSGAERQQLYTGDTRQTVGERDSLEFVRGLAAECAGVDPISQAMYIDVHSFLPNNVLQYGDRMSMAHSLEARVPLADHTLFELLAKVPASLKMRGGTSKYLLRQCMASHLPSGTVQRKKRGFNPPMGVWLNTRLKGIVDEFLSEETLRRRGYFEPAPVQAMLRDHRASHRDYTWHLWSLILFEQWHRMYLDSGTNV